MTDALEQLRVVADYQFGAGVGAALFAPPVEVRHTSSGRPEQVLTEAGERLVTYGVDGRFTLGAAGGLRLHAAPALAAPAYRVFVGAESDPYVREGRNAFAKFVVEVDPAIRPQDEVLVVHERALEAGAPSGADLLGTGRARLSAEAMEAFESGVAVKIREGLTAPETAG